MSKLILPPPFDKKRNAIKLSAYTENQDRLIIRHYPDYALLPIIIMVLLLAGLSTLFYLGDVPIFIYPIIFLIYIFDYLRTKREITCIIDKQEAKFTYHRRGVLGRDIGEQIVVGNIYEINRVKVKKYMRRIGYTFKIILVLRNGKQLPVSSSNLSLNHCKRFVKKLLTFLDHEITIDGIKYPAIVRR